MASAGQVSFKWSGSPYERCLPRCIPDGKEKYDLVYDDYDIDMMIPLKKP